MYISDKYKQKCNHRKKKLLNKNDQKQLLEKFYDDLVQEEYDYLSNAFENDNVVYYDREETSDSHSDI